ncbi:MAG: hypothetical protein ACM3O4_00105 [Ignavibacteriales bacterium]
MNKKGFTLLELMAIIILLGIIASIVVPIILSIFTRAREAAFLDTAYGLMKASEYEYVNNLIKGKEATELKVYYPQDKDRLKASGQMPDGGGIIMSKTGEITLGLWSDTVGKCAVKSYDEIEVRYDESILTKEDCMSGGPTEITTEMWDGWITLTLFYPADSTDRQWRLGNPGEVRTEGSFMWQDYTGPIIVPLSRVEDIWIKYKIDNQEVTIPPAGTLLVDIIPDSYGSKLVDKVKVKINYDESATTKEYRVGNSDWQPYNGEFTVTENCMIEARAKKADNVYDANGNLLLARNIVGRDAVYIGNIGVEEIDIPAPTIERLDPISGDEVARVRVTYPESASQKIYKINYGLEQTYSQEISIKKYGTYVIAYYYDANGKRSNSRSILINEKFDGAGNYDPLPPRNPGDPIPVDPIYIVPAPIVSVNPPTLTTSVQVSVVSPANADRVYIKLGTGSYVPYTGPVTVTSNMQISAYYITYEGEKSDIGYGRVSNIKQNNRPYLSINADPYPYPGSFGAKNVVVTLDYSDADKVEYSLDGVVFVPYTNAFSISQNMRIYGRATNSYGTTTAELDITNIGYMVPPAPKDNLLVTITAAPEPLVSKTLTDKVLIKIEYDKRTDKKYYSLGKYGPLVEYTGEFEVTSNTTIYAYALSENGKGQASKKIDNISSGIAEPNIIGNPVNTVQTSKTNITIEYDKNATIKRYSVNGGPLRDYTSSFDVTTNGEIYAYSKNALGQSSESTYDVTNIISPPPTFVIDMGDYFILKLNYPPNSKGREYKFTKAGVWKPYNEVGILLIKPQYKDQLLNSSNELKIKIRNENGDEIDFSGDWYVLDFGISDIKEYIFMRWDRTTPPAPQIIPDKLEPTAEVNVTILYDSSLVKKQYKVVGPDGTIISDYGTYNGKFKITKNNTIIYARGQDDAEVWSIEVIYKITNIDEEQPVIKLTTDLVTATRKLGIKVDVTDDVEVAKVKWAKGVLGESYFATGGTEIPNNTIVNITENAYYTFYAEDGVGNKQVYTINVENVDLTPPIIEITATPEDVVGLNSLVTINFGDSTTKQYKIGNGTTWTNYTAPFNVTSYNVLSGNLQNADETVTIFAKGKDSLGNEVTVSKKLVNLDLDMPASPVITSNAGYAILASYGITVDATTVISYDNRTDIDNYYSIDNGVTWIKYTGSFQMASGTIRAKSVKRTTGLEVSVTKTIGMPSDAITTLAYDKNDSTGVSAATGLNYYMIVDDSMQGNKIRVKWQMVYTIGRIRFLDANKIEISNITRNPNANTNLTVDEIYTIPLNTKWIKYEGTISGGGYTNYLYEIQPSNEPTFAATNGYMLLHADPTKQIKQPYQMVTINYFATSVQRLYRIGTTGEWLNYIDQPIKLNQGEIVYAKGIDQYGNETRTTPSYTANVTDAITSGALDGNDSTSMSAATGLNYYMAVDESMQGNRIRVKWQMVYTIGRIRFLDVNKQEISNITRNPSANTNLTVDENYIIPLNTKWIKYEGTISGGGYTNYLYEIQPANEPTFAATSGYMLLHTDQSKQIKKPYQMITISYYTTSVQRLYRIGTTGEWLNYNNQPVKLNQGETIYAKGIDKYGNESRIIPSYTASIPDAINPEATDGNDGTAHWYLSTTKYIDIDPSVQGKTIRLKLDAGRAASTMTYLNSSGNAISTVDTKFTGERTYVIPAGTTRLAIYTGGGYSDGLYIYEIQIANEPVLTTTNKYILLHANPAQQINTPYQMVTINYFPTSVQKLYRIGTTGNWLEYTSPVKVNQGETIYAKGIDQYGNETRITVSLTANVADAILSPAVDGNDTTAYWYISTTKYIDIDPSVQGKTIRLKINAGRAACTMSYLDSSGNVISTVDTKFSGERTYVIPAGTTRLAIYTGGGYSDGLSVYEIQVMP